MNALQFLLEEHNKVRKMFSEIESMPYSNSNKKNIFSKLCYDLLVHEKMEQTVWYPHFKNVAPLEGIIEHLLHEEQEAHKAIKEFEDIKTREEWEKKFLKFKKDVAHHASEEESKLFPLAKSILTTEELESIGSKMIKFKEEYRRTIPEHINIKMPDPVAEKPTGLQGIVQKLKTMFNDIFK